MDNRSSCLGFVVKGRQYKCIKLTAYLTELIVANYKLQITNFLWLKVMTQWSWISCQGGGIHLVYVQFTHGGEWVLTQMHMLAHGVTDNCVCTHRKRGRVKTYSLSILWSCQMLDDVHKTLSNNSVICLTGFCRHLSLLTNTRQTFLSYAV